MRGEHILIFQISGLSLPTGVEKVNILSQPSVSIDFVSSLSSAISGADTSSAIANVTIDTIFRGVSGAFVELLPKYLQGLKDARGAKFPGPYLVLIREFEAEVCDCKRAELDEFVVGFDLFDKKSVRCGSELYSERAIAAMYLMSQQDYKVELICDEMYLVDKDSRRWFSLNIDGYADVSSSIHLSEAMACEVSCNLVSMLVDKNLATVSRLLMKSRSERDRLKSFIYSWTALEVFVNKLYSKICSNCRCPLNGRFVCLSLSLGVGSAEVDADAKVFHGVKKIRDKLTHGENVKDDDLPIADILSLLKKYMRFYLQKSES